MEDLKVDSKEENSKKEEEEEKDHSEVEEEKDESIFTNDLRISINKFINNF